MRKRIYDDCSIFDVAQAKEVFFNTGKADTVVASDSWDAISKHPDTLEIVHFIKAYNDSEKPFEVIDYDGNKSRHTFIRAVRLVDDEKETEKCKDETAEASFACTIREITAHTVNNAGKAVPFAVNHYYSASIDKTPKMYVNGTVFSLGGLASESIWDEYASAVLRSGNNVVAAFIDYGSFDASGANGTIKIRYRKGVL